jgi:hypothetical protein
MYTKVNQKPPAHHEGWMDGWMNGWMMAIRGKKKKKKKM